MAIATPLVPANMNMENLRNRLAAGDARVAEADLDSRACGNMHLIFIKPGNPVADMFENPFIGHNVTASMAKEQKRFKISTGAPSASALVFLRPSSATIVTHDLLHGRSTPYDGMPT
ncbi:hypothetical protein EMCG_01867 [[Emmonsia] crescens]|uniref:Uncharacterized protein n=1 Tax=[Emmonsia] crescens TaxID=73230 RepID=A0A0G2I0D0_9EURO|nr:hypothetical protein EMCG_01867 [Emmonsia crescens UAMH 3008]